MGPLYLGKMGTFVNFRYINNLAIDWPTTDDVMFRYVIVKVVRKDHLDHLPVPSRIKKYLNTPFYYSEQVMLIFM